MHSSIRLDTPIEFINVTPINPLISKCQIKVCYVGDEPNRNKSVITKEVARQMANSLPGSPIVGFYNEGKSDFEEHNRVIDISNGKFTIKDVTRPYGFVDLNAKVWFAKYLDDESVEREYLVTEGYLWTGQYPECKRILEHGNNQSMELDKDTLNAFWTRDNNFKPQFFIVNEAIISKLCILGESNEPCFEGSNITEPVVQFSFDDSFKEELFSMINELKDLLNKGGAKVFTKYSVTIGDALWDALYGHVESNFAEHTIESVCEEEEQKFAVLATNDKYYRLNFSIAESGEYEFAAELTEIEAYTPDENPQFSAEEIAEYAKKKNEDKSGKEDNDESHNDSEGDEEKKCPKCGKPVEECTCEDEEEEEKKKAKYSLSEIPEYVELETKFNELSANYEALMSEKIALEAKIAPLAEFKAQAEKKEKEDMIESFYMLSDEDKADVIENIDTYSLNDIEAKLSIICVRNRVNFNPDEDSQPKGPTVFSLEGSADDEDATTPAWVKAAMKVAKTMN